ncbi:aminopeptidase N [Pseudomonadota bacterium]|nr:aminopeptidase N [Pseudomonadota bacterium]
MRSIIKNRKDYKPLLWVPNNIFLDISIFDDFSLIKSEIFFKKNKLFINKKNGLDHYIELNGVNLETVYFSVIIDNDKPFNIDLDTLTRRNEVLLLPVPVDAFSIKILSKVKIYPKENISLEGLYESNEMFCTQCEPEGFRKITWFTDRPDCLATFKVRIEGSNFYSTMLSNGNLIEAGNVKVEGKKTGRHFSIWSDPFPKPSYLFALIVGNLEISESSFITSSNKNIELKIFTEIGNKHLTTHAMKSLKKAMAWDEKKYGLEYDLKTFMIVAVSHFNMGAMENKGLNIFNSKFVLADESTATDTDLGNIESIVAHEYFHNWTGNRVTCRDWFQLTLKEGLTVFRDQEFSADMNDKDVKRIEDVLLLKSIQFPEDAGSNSHSIRPDEYIEINNFYTPTIYEKGAEVIRMIVNYIGEENYRNGMNAYFRLYDGQAVTCEDFLKALTLGSNISLDLFKKWYNQSGTPNVNIIRTKNKYDWNFNISQSINNQPSDLPIPIKISLINKNGSLIKFKIDNSELNIEHVYLLSKSNDNIKISSETLEVTPSLLRNFSAPVILKTDLVINDYLHILKFDNDGFNKWDAIQNLYLDSYLNNNNVYSITLVLRDLLSKKFINFSLLSFLLDIPSRGTFEHFLKISNPIQIFKKRKELMKIIGVALQDIFEIKAVELFNYKINADKKNGERALLDKILNYLVLINNKVGVDLAKKISLSKNMTISITGLKSLCLYGSEPPLDLLNKFFIKWKNDNLVIEKWFELMSSLNIEGKGLIFIKDLLSHESFEYKNPNKIRSVLGAFQKENVLLFHANDSSGYDFISEQVSLIDKNNPQVAARLVLPLTRFSNYDEFRKNKMKKALKNISNQSISPDLSEIVNKALR